MAEAPADRSRSPEGRHIRRQCAPSNYASLRQTFARCVFPTLLNASREYIDNHAVQNTKAFQAEDAVKNADLDSEKADLEAKYARKVAALEAKEAELAAAWDELRDEDVNLKKSEEALEEEKRRMTGNCSMNDVIHLNIGGEKNVAVLRRTLCLIEDSMLASYFSGRWEDSLARDKDGAVLIDFDQELFMPLLSYLRTKQVEDPASPASFPKLKAREEEFRRVLNFYGIEEFITASFAPFRFETDATDLAVDGCTVTRLNRCYWKRAFGNIAFHLSQLTRPVGFKIKVCDFGSFGTLNRDYYVTGPNVGFADVSLTSCNDASEQRKSAGKLWVYACGNGELLSPDRNHLVGSSRRPAAEQNDVITVILHPDGKVSMRRNDEDFGIVFCGLPASVKPVVEMNAKDSSVELLV